MSVEFRSVASPHVGFTAAVIHNQRGDINNYYRGFRNFFMGSGPKARNAMSIIAMRSMEKFLLESHIPSLAAGNQHMSFIMGDFNVLKDAFVQDVRDAIHK